MNRGICYWSPMEKIFTYRHGRREREKRGSFCFAPNKTEWAFRLWQAAIGSCAISSSSSQQPTGGDTKRIINYTRFECNARWRRQRQRVNAFDTVHWVIKSLVNGIGKIFKLNEIKIFTSSKKEKQKSIRTQCQKNQMADKGRTCVFARVLVCRIQWKTYMLQYRNSTEAASKVARGRFGDGFYFVRMQMNP